MSRKRDSWKIPFGAGVASGIIVAIAVKTGVSLEQEYYLRLILSSVCDLSSSTIKEGSSFNKPDCGMYLFLFDILTILISVGAFLGIIFATRNVLQGIILYFLGFALGFILIFLFLH